jgi:hypothetical protein
LFGKALLAKDEWLLKNFDYETFFDGGVVHELNSVTSLQNNISRSKGNKLSNKNLRNV